MQRGILPSFDTPARDDRHLNAVDSDRGGGVARKAEQDGDKEKDEKRG